MTGKPVLAARASENVLFPDPASPVTMTRRPSANGASLIATSVPQVPLGCIRDTAHPAKWDTLGSQNQGSFWCDHNRVLELSNQAPVRGPQRPSVLVIDDVIG